MFLVGPFVDNELKCGNQPTSVRLAYQPTTDLNEYCMPKTAILNRLYAFISIPEIDRLRWPVSQAVVCQQLNGAVDIKDLQNIIYDYARFELSISMRKNALEILSITINDWNAIPSIDRQMFVVAEVNARISVQIRSNDPCLVDISAGISVRPS